MLGKLPDCRFYLINLFPEFQIPYVHFFPLNSKLLTCTFLLLIKRVGLKWNLRPSVRVQTIIFSDCQPSAYSTHKESIPVSAYWVWQVTGSTHARVSGFKTNIPSLHLSRFLFSHCQYLQLILYTYLSSLSLVFPSRT